MQGKLEDIMKRKVKNCRPSRFADWLYTHGQLILFHTVYGIESGIPLCCILYFCWHTWRGMDRPAIYAGCYYNPKCIADYVHCPWCKKTQHT